MAVVGPPQTILVRSGRASVKCRTALAALGERSTIASKPPDFSAARLAGGCSTGRVR